MSKKFKYSDGEEVENYLLLYFQGRLTKNRMKEFESNWAFIYHTSPFREHLLDWYPFKKSGSLLEIGAGCGALTGVFCDRTKKVTAVELSPRRASIIKARYEGRPNLEVVTGDANRLNLREKFDYVTCIGVLEYSALINNSTDPFGALIAVAKSYLKPGGKLILAIENKFGLKYWAGAPEDHTGNYFDSIEGYKYSGSLVRTYGRKELEKILEGGGLKNLRFYYPLPDYKFPIEIFSDNYLPSGSHLPQKHNIDIFNAPPGFGDRAFDEFDANRELVNEGTFQYFANSFLVIAEVK